MLGVVRLCLVAAILAVVFSSCPVGAQDDFTVDDAYRSIPHQQTPFSSKQTELAPRESAYLKELFFLTDLAMRARVLVMVNVYHGRGGMDIRDYNTEVGMIFQSMDALETPPGLDKAQKLIIESVLEQYEFLNEWAAATGDKRANIKKSYARHKLVQSSHKKLLKAYSLLMKNFPRETRHNKQAFYDHLCALDFL